MAWIVGITTALGVLSCAGLGSSVFGHLFDREVTSMPTIMHFTGVHASTKDVNVFNHMVIEPQGDNTAIYRNGEFVAHGNFTQVSVIP